MMLGETMSDHSKIYLHVGPEKTGTTSIQDSLFASRDKLHGLGASYWSILANHSWPLVLILEVSEMDAPDFDTYMQNHFKYKYGTKSKIKQTLLEELRSSPGKFILSSEIVSRFPKKYLVNLRDLLYSATPDVTIIYYVREPGGWLNSIVQQRLKAGIPLSEAIATNRRLPYRSTIEMMDEVFGTNNVKIRRFTKNSDVAVSLIADFLDAVDLPKAAAADFPLLWENQSISADAARFLDAVARVGRDRGVERLYGWFLNAHLASAFKGAPCRLDDRLLDAVAAENADQIEWLTARMDGAAFELTEEPGRGACPVPVEGPLSERVFSLTSEILNLRSTVLFQQGVIKRERGELRAACEAFAQALTHNPDHPAAALALSRLATRMERLGAGGRSVGTFKPALPAVRKKF
jgi:hypothetical protein